MTQAPLVLQLAEQQRERRNVAATRTARASEFELASASAVHRCGRGGQRVGGDAAAAQRALGAVAGQPARRQRGTGAGGRGTAQRHRRPDAALGRRPRPCSGRRRAASNASLPKAENAHVADPRQPARPTAPIPGLANGLLRRWRRTVAGRRSLRRDHRRRQDARFQRTHALRSRPPRAVARTLPRRRQPLPVRQQAHARRSHPHRAAWTEQVRTRLRNYLKAHRSTTRCCSAAPSAWSGGTVRAPGTRRWRRPACWSRCGR